MTAKRKEFSQNEASELLVACHRRCCVCHRYCGVKLEIHHIGDASDNNIENAIPLCFDCHAEVALYNPTHPKGRKFRPDELKGHRDQWIETCKTASSFLASIPTRTEVGPIEGLVTELEFNKSIAEVLDGNNMGAGFEQRQFVRCMNEGVLAVFEERLKQEIFALYRKIKEANHIIENLPVVASYERSRAGSGADPKRKAFSLAQDVSSESQSILENLRQLV